MHNSQSGVVVAVHLRCSLQRAAPSRAVNTTRATSDRAADSATGASGEGYLLNVTAYSRAGRPRRGQTFIGSRSSAAAARRATLLGTLIQGYVTGNQDLAWPGSPLEGSLEGNAIRRCSPDRSGGRRRHLRNGPDRRAVAPEHGESALVASATVGARSPHVQFAGAAGPAIGCRGRRGIITRPTWDWFWQRGMPISGNELANKGIGGLPET